ncbi:MAG TPA: hypothetical protein VMS99_00835 [Acidimicrobiia bacterium]|nr:hypothetical protein [Acidimicrobiia bacterium]
MRDIKIGLLTAVALLLAACGGVDSGAPLPSDPEAPVLQLRSEGGFSTPEMNLGRGPTYTLLADGRLIYEGPVILIFPGPLLPNYQVVQLTEDTVDEILSRVDEIGLPGMGSETDDSAASNVADATTEVITYWDGDGIHQYSVYGLGIEPNPTKPATAAALALVNALSEAAFSVDAVEYVGDRVRVISAVASAPPEPGFEDVRAWPLDGENPGQWAELNLGFTCKVFGPDLIETFRNATQVTQWLHPEETMDAPPFVLLVRPLHPGEPDCPGV